jgi:hypothetical protein
MRARGTLRLQSIPCLALFLCLLFLSPEQAVSSVAASAKCSLAFSPVGTTTLAASTDFNAIGGRNGSDLWAVGQGGIYGSSSFTEHWDGSKWIRIDTPGSGVTLNALAGIGSRDVWAVGSHPGGRGLRTAAMHWNGSRWSVMYPPSGRGDVLYGVTGTSNSDVWAVGSTGEQIRTHASALHWDGKSWSGYQLVPANSIRSTVLGVTAISSTDVWAVGWYTSESGANRYHALLYHWDGNSWTSFPGPNVNGNVELHSVFPVSTTEVWAVGSVGDKALTERWNGSAWTFVGSPSLPTPAVLNSVSGTGTGDVWAVGNNGQSPVAAHWNGSGWQPVSLPSIPDSTVQLTGINALSPHDAVAVGVINPSSFQPVGLILRWDGSSWQRVSFYDGNPFSQELTTVATPLDSPELFGTYTDLDGRTRVLGAELGSGNAGAWPPTGAGGDFVTDSSGPSSLAVGYSLDAAGNEQTWINGTQGPSPGVLFGVSAPSQTEAWAVGRQNDASGDQQTLAIHFDGSTWTVIPSADPGITSVLRGVAEVSANDVWAVGFQRGDSGTVHSLIEHWDGATWNVVNSPDGAGTNTVLESVAALAADDVWAVGHFKSDTGALRTIAENWNGSSWKVSKTPNVGTVSNTLLDVEAAPGGGILASGSYDVAASQSAALILFYDGRDWTTALSQAPPAGTSQQIEGLALAPGNPVGVAVGGSISADGFSSNLAFKACEVSIRDDGFSQSSADTMVGAPTFWYIDAADTSSHRLVDSSPLGLFDSGLLAPGATWAYALRSAGTYPVEEVQSGDTLALNVGLRVPFPGVAGSPLTLVWATSNAKAGLVYDVQVKPPGAQNWQAVVTGATTGNGTYTPSSSGTYQFRARTRDPSSGKSLGWSSAQAVDVADS